MDPDTEINVDDEDYLETNFGGGASVDEDIDDLDSVDVSDRLEAITPKVDMEFPSEEDAFYFYNRYSLKMGFGIRKSQIHRSKLDPNLVIARNYVCRMQGKKKVVNEETVGSSRGSSRELRVDCNARMKIIRKESGNWRVSIFVPEHVNHEMSTPSKVVKHFSHKKTHRQPPVKNLMTKLHDNGLSNANIAKVINSLEPDPEFGVTGQNVHDHLRVKRKNNMGKNCANVVRHFMEKRSKDPHFYSSIQVDDDMTLRSVFWADGRSREAYKEFSDVIVFDVTYRTNSFSLPFAPFTGINHHRQSSLFGCALLADETEKTFIWLFEQWLDCMGMIAPGAIITDQDAAIGNAIAKVFPATVHRYCDWHLNKKIGEHMVSLKAIHGPEIESHFNTLRASSTESEAESTWNEMTTRYQLQNNPNNSWLPRLWGQRKHWVHCYSNATFLAGMTSSQRSESMNAFFDNFVHASTPLDEFVLQYDKALTSRRRAEEDEDFKSMETKVVPQSGWPLEVQAGKCYTRALFAIFSKEIKDSKALYWAERVSKEGTLHTFSVVRAGCDDSTGRTVSYNSVGHVVSCSCRQFEFVGLLCRHALCVYWKKLVKEIPIRYILKRWTLEARYRPVAVDMGDDVGLSEVDRDRHWGIRYKLNKAAELAYKSPKFAEEIDRILTRKFVEYETVDELSQAPNSQVEPIAPHLSQTSSNLTTRINVLDPTAPARHKGRPRLAARMMSSLEESQVESAKKKRKCGYCGELGHYRTGCSKAKENNVVDEDSEEDEVFK